MIPSSLQSVFVCRALTREPSCTALQIGALQDESRALKNSIADAQRETSLKEQDVSVCL